MARPHYIAVCLLFVLNPNLTLADASRAQCAHKVAAYLERLGASNGKAALKSVVLSYVKPLEGEFGKIQDMKRLANGRIVEFRYSNKESNGSYHGGAPGLRDPDYSGQRFSFHFPDVKFPGMAVVSTVGNWYEIEYDNQCNLRRAYLAHPELRSPYAYDVTPSRCNEIRQHLKDQPGPPTQDFLLRQGFVLKKEVLAYPPNMVGASLDDILADAEPAQRQQGFVRQLIGCTEHGLLDLTHRPPTSGPAQPPVSTSR